MIDYLKEKIEIDKLSNLNYLPNWAIENLNGKIDLFVNFISFQEMEPDIVENYAFHIQRLEPEFLLLRNLREGKQKKTNGNLGVKKPILKDDYFLVKDVRLTSDETHKKLIKDSFKRTIKTRFGGGHRDQVKTFKQEIQIINSARSRTKPKLQFLEDYHNKIQTLNKSGMELYLELGGEYNPDLQHIHKQILEQKKSFNTTIKNWSDREKYKWSILEIKKPLTDEERL